MNLLVYVIIFGFIIGGSFLLSSNDDISNKAQRSDQTGFLNVIDYSILNQSEKINKDNNTEENPKSSYENDTIPLYDLNSPIYYLDDNKEVEIEEKIFEAEDLQSRTEDLNWQINRLRRNADSYDSDEFVSKLKKWNWKPKIYRQEQMI